MCDTKLSESTHNRLHDGLSDEPAGSLPLAWHGLDICQVTLLEKGKPAAAHIPRQAHKKGKVSTWTKRLTAKKNGFPARGEIMLTPHKHTQDFAPHEKVNEILRQDW